MSCFFCYTFYTAANLYPGYNTLFSTAALLGLAAGPLWAAQCTIYLTTLAISFADVVSDIHTYIHTLGYILYTAIS